MQLAGALARTQARIHHNNTLISPLGCIFRCRLVIEAQADPSITAYSRMLVHSISRLLRPAVCSLIAHVVGKQDGDGEIFSQKNDWVDRGALGVEHEKTWATGGDALIDMQTSMEVAVMRSVWESLSEIADQSLRKRHRERDAAVGHITVGEVSLVTHLMCTLMLRVRACMQRMCSLIPLCVSGREKNAA